MGEGRSIWVGKDEHHGVLSQPRTDAPRAEHWRLEAIAHTPRPRSLSVGPGGRRAVFIQDGDDRSDVWLIDLEDGSPPRASPPAATRCRMGGHDAAALAGRRHGGLRRR